MNLEKKNSIRGTICCQGVIQLPLEILSFGKLVIIHGNLYRFWGVYPYYQVKICISVTVLIDPMSHSGNSNSHGCRGLADSTHELGNPDIKIFKVQIL